MNTCLVLATDSGITLCEHRGDTWRRVADTLVGRQATSVISHRGAILVGTTAGIFHSDDGGRSWQERSDGLGTRHVRWMVFDPARSGRAFAGTEPAGIFVSDNEALTWRGCAEVEALRDRFQWFLPYSPEAGCVRGFAFHGDRVYAAVEVGGVLRSDDAGETWRLADGSTGEPLFDIPPAPLVHADVHSVVSHPRSADGVFAVTAEGLYRSNDGGATWTVSHAGSYCRAAWVDPADPDHIVLSPADSVARKNGRIEESHDGGSTWRLASEGLDLPWPDRMAERFIPVGDELFAVTNDGCFYVAPVGSLRWQRILPEIEGVRAVVEYVPAR